MSTSFPDVSIPAFNKYITMIEPTTDAIVSAPIEVRSGQIHTLVCTNITGGAEEYIKLEIYDTTTETWQDFYKYGEVLKMTAGSTIAVLRDLSALIRFNKTETASPVGLSINRNAGG